MGTPLGIISLSQKMTVTLVLGLLLVACVLLRAVC